MSSAEATVFAPPPPTTAHPTAYRTCSVVGWAPGPAPMAGPGGPGPVRAVLSPAPGELLQFGPNSEMMREEKTSLSHLC